jgi:5,10-methylenetetrahydromethanopterin reductase
MFPGVAAAALLDAVVAAEELGLDEVWVADEGVARDPIPVLAAAATRTNRIGLATGVTSPILRHPGVIAASIATVDELSGGRATLGLGVGGHLALGPFGLEVEHPVRRLRESIEIVRAVHAGVATDGYHPPAHAAPPRRIPIWVGARGPQLVGLAARVADGLFLSGCSPEQLDRIVADAAVVGEVEIAIYQTAVDRPSGPNELGWNAAGDALAMASAAFTPAAIGINLVQLATEGTDPIPLVERAAALLLAC